MIFKTSASKQVLLRSLSLSLSLKLENATHFSIYMYYHTDTFNNTFV